MTRPRSLLRSKRLWGGVGVVVLLLVIAGALLGWRALEIRHDLSSAQQHAKDIRKAVSAGETAKAGTALASFNKAIDAAKDHSDSFLWRAAGHLPFLGDDARAIALVSQVGSDVGHHALGPLLQQVGGDLPERLAPHNGRVDLGAISRLRPSLDRAAGPLSSAVARLDTVDASSLSGMVRPSFDKLVAQVRDARAGVVAADRAAKVMPTMLGADGPRRYLVLFDNNAEVRATGGMPGAWAIISAEHGRLDLVRQGTASEIGEFPAPVLPQSKAEKRIYDRQIATYFQDTNFTPDFPRTANLARAMFAKKYGEHLDGVLSVDAVTLGGLIKATGPIHAPFGVTLTADNATDMVLNGIYRRLPENATQDAFYRDVAGQVFDKVKGGVDSPTALVRALAQGVQEGRIYLHSFHADEQQVLDPSEIAGRVDFADASTSHTPQLGIFLNDATGSKMSYYLRATAHLSAEACHGGQQELSGYVDFHMNRPPKDLNEFITGGGGYGTPKGEQTVLARIYGPAGGELSNFSLDGRKFKAYEVTDRGREVATLAIQLKGGQSVRVRWTTRTALDQPGATRLRMTPGMTSAPAIRTISTKCAPAPGP